MISSPIVRLSPIIGFNNSSSVIVIPNFLAIPYLVSFGSTVYVVIVSFTADTPSVIVFVDLKTGIKIETEIEIIQ
jgi:hypothetical protein